MIYSLTKEIITTRQVFSIPMNSTAPVRRCLRKTLMRNVDSGTRETASITMRGQVQSIIRPWALPLAIERSINDV